MKIPGLEQGDQIAFTAVTAEILAEDEQKWLWPELIDRLKKERPGHGSDLLLVAIPEGTAGRVTRAMVAELEEAA